LAGFVITLFYDKNPSPAKFATKTRKARYRNEVATYGTVDQKETLVTSV
jgi:hypothetical protein